MSLANCLEPIGAGTWPDYVSAIGTVGTLATAVWVLKRDGDDRRKRDDFERSQQARSIHMGRVTQTQRAAGTHVDHMCQCIVTNDSDDYIHDLELLLQLKPPTVAVGYDEDDPRRRDPNRWSFLGRANEVAPGETATFMHTFRVAWDAEQAEAREHTIDALLSFRDAADLRWQRGSDYRLRDITFPYGGYVGSLKTGRPLFRERLRLRWARIKDRGRSQRRVPTWRSGPDAGDPW